MLSFDITDRHIRIVRGTEARGNIRLSAATTIDLAEGLIVNGHIKDIPKLANIINDELKAQRMDDKEAVVTISSNLVIFKELHIPKAKTSAQMLTMVTNQMQHTMGIAEEYSISYSIAGEVEEDGVQAQKILATACPFEVVDCFRKVFTTMLNIQLKSVCVSCNAISRLILSDRKMSSRMPMLVVQVDPNFVSINLYENGQLSFARFASIDAVDYDNSDDYIYEAVNENIYRMVQFHKSRNTNNPIQNVIFYGDTSEYIRLTNYLESMDITTSQLSVNTSNISGYENIEALVYANAIGAMFRSNKDVDRINLLETDSSAGRSDAGSGYVIKLLGAVVLSAAVVAAGYFGLSAMINTNEAEIAKIDEWINSEETQNQIMEVDKTQAKIDKVNLYKTDLDVALRGYETKPKFTVELYDTLVGLVEAQEGCMVKSFGFGSGVVSMKIFAGDVLSPDLIVQSIYELDRFDNIVYTGFRESTEVFRGETNNDSAVFEFEVRFNMRPNEVEEPEKPAAENEEGGDEE